MKKDIEFPKVTDVGLAAIPVNKEEGEFWEVHVINLKPSDINNVLISSKGYGKQKGKEIKTSALRHYFELIESKGSRMVELISADLEGINNEFLLSFYIGRKIFDKKFVFLPDTLLLKNMTEVPLLNQKGILI